ncbi:Tol-Pal system protein TolB [Haliea atlantica]
MKAIRVFLLTAWALFLAHSARAELVIEITQGMDNPTAIAVAPFDWAGGGTPPEDVAQVIENDLARSGQFAPVDRGDMLARPTRQQEIFYRDWRAINSEYLLIGRVSVTDSIQMRIEYELYDVNRQARILNGYEEGHVRDARMLSHRVADEVYETLTGVRGAFSTRLLYVAVERVPGEKSVYRLTMSDSDGARPVVLLESREPLLAPSWSPDAKHIAYVSFETSRPAIFRQELATGAREQLTNFQGLNGSPAWSPDGRRMAMVLSKDGSPDIYVMDLASKALTRITRHYAIDTEPTWSPDGRSIYFTSDRGGRPQIYRYDMASGNTERVTFEGRYNARARLAQDGRSMVVVHQSDGQFHIALQDLVSKRLFVLTSTDLDESPSIAPNGSMVLYATKSGDRGILAAVSVDGGVKFRLPSREGDVREPAWSPFLPRGQ